jgi:ATP-dependent helicase HrpA
VNLRLFRNLSDARKHTGDGIRKLVELAIGRDLIAIRKELQQLGKSLASTATKQSQLRGRDSFDNLATQLQIKHDPHTVDLETFINLAIERLMDHAFKWDSSTPLEKDRFEKFVEFGRRALPGICYQMGEYCRQIVAVRETVLKSPKRFTGMEAEVERIAPKNLLAHATFDRLQHIPRYLKAVLVRAERAVLNPKKDAEKEAQLAPFVQWQKYVPESDHPRFRWLLEELRVSIFAQELGTAESVSVTKLKAMCQFTLAPKRE